MKRNELGFTLLELLAVLLVISVLLAIVIPFSYSIIQKQQTKHFLNLLESDIFYIQNQSIGTRTNGRIILEQDRYLRVVGIGDKGETIIRPYPRNTDVISAYRRISFNNKGNFTTPNSYIIRINGIQYKLVFALGKGRYYIEESP